HPGVEKMGAGFLSYPQRGTNRFRCGQEDGCLAAEEQQGKKDETVRNRDVSFYFGDGNAETRANHDRRQSHQQEPNVELGAGQVRARIGNDDEAGEYYEPNIDLIFAAGVDHRVVPGDRGVSSDLARWQGPYRDESYNIVKKLEGLVQLQSDVRSFRT